MDSLEDIAAEALLQEQSSGICHLGKVCDVCDCFAELPGGRQERDRHVRDEVRAVLSTITQDMLLWELGRHAFREHGEVTEEHLYRMWISCKCGWNQDISVTWGQPQRKIAQDIHLAEAPIARLRA